MSQGDISLNHCLIEIVNTWFDADLMLYSYIMKYRRWRPAIFRKNCLEPLLVCAEKERNCKQRYVMLQLR